MPNAEVVRSAIEACDFTVVSDLFATTDTARLADIVLPATGWGEKDGTVTNSDRTISRQRAALPPPGEARHDWDIFADVGRRMGWDLPNMRRFRVWRGNLAAILIFRLWRICLRRITKTCRPKDGR